MIDANDAAITAELQAQKRAAAAGRAARRDYRAEEADY